MANVAARDHRIHWMDFSENYTKDTYVKVISIFNGL